MRYAILAGLALAAGAATEASAAVRDPAAALGVLAPVLQQQDYYQDQYDYDRDYQSGIDVRVWLEDRRDLFGVGDRSRVYVRASQDAYVAVFHIDTNGDLEILYPYTSYDDGYVYGGRTLSLAARGASRYVRMHSGYGLGYVFAVASDEPLDLGRVRHLWSARYAGWDSNRSIYGDPFYHIDRIVRELVPDYGYGYHDVDVYSYHVGGRYTHPRYACYDGYGSWYGSRSRYYDSCDRVRILLVSQRYYYDTRHYRGDRRRYYDRYYYADRRRDPPPAHGYKESTDPRSDGDRPSRSQRRPASGVDGSPPPARERDWSAGDQQQEPDRRVTQPSSRQRPTLQRRPSDEESSRPSSDEGRRAEPVRRSTPERTAPPPRTSSPRSSEPRSSSPPPSRRAEPRSEPRSSSPPRESSEPRSRPSESSPSRVRPGG